MTRPGKDRPGVTVMAGASLRRATRAPAVGEAAVARFTADGRQSLSRPISPGGTLQVEYDLTRLPVLRGSGEFPAAWDVVAWMRTHPSTQLYSASLVDHLSGYG